MKLTKPGQLRSFAAYPRFSQTDMDRILEAPSGRRRTEFLAAVSRSRDLHRRIVAPPRTVEAFERYLERLRRPAHIGYWIRTRENELAGVINISEIVRGHGHMSRGLRA